MLKPRHLLVVFLLALGFVITALVLAGNQTSEQGAGAPLFPKLLGRLNDVTRVTISAAGKSFNIENSELGWHIPLQDNYRADANKMHKLLVGLSGLKRIEAKTRKPSLYQAIGVRDPAAGVPNSKAITLSDKAGTPLLRLIVGLNRPARADPSSEEYYVRRVGDPQSWLVEGVLPQVGSHVSDWLDKKIVMIDASRLQQTVVTHADGEVVTAYREAPKDRNFSYRELPEGRQLADEWRMNDLGRFIADLDSQGVYAKANAPAADAMLEVQSQTFDGLLIKLRASQAKDQGVYVELAAAYDGHLANTGNVFKDDNLKSADQVRAEVEQLNRRWQGWVYKLPKFKADYLRKRQADFLKKQPAN